MVDLFKSQYLDAAGLGVFYGLIKDQWIKADQEQYTKITKDIWGGESAPTEISNLQAAEDAIKKNASDIAELVEALATEVELRTQEDAKLLGTSEDESGAATIHGALKAIAEEATARDNADKAIIGEVSDQSKSTITGLAYNLDKEVGGLTESISAETTARNEAIAAEVKAREDADKELGERIDILTTGGISPDWLSNDWLPVNVDEDSIKIVEGTPRTIKLPDGTDSTEFTPQLLTSNLVLDLNDDNKIVLKSATNGEKTYGEVDLSSIVMDRVLTAGSVIYDEKDTDPEEGYIMAEGLVYPYIAFTISAYDKETATETKEYIRVSVKDLVDEYTAEGGVEIVRTDVDGGQPTKTIKLTQEFLDRIAGIEQSVAAEKTRAEEAEGVISENLTTTASNIRNEFADADTALGERIDGVNQAISNEKTRAEAAEGALDERIDALEAGQLDIDFMSNIWKIHDVDGITTVSIKGEEVEYTKDDGTTYKYTPTLVKTNLTLVQKGTDTLENNHIIELQDGNKIAHGSIDLRNIIEAIPTETINSICGVGTEEPEAGA